MDLDVEDKRGRTPLHYSAAGVASLDWQGVCALANFGLCLADLDKEFVTGSTMHHSLKVSSYINGEKCLLLSFCEPEFVQIK